jgi:hypothetical protein
MRNRAVEAEAKKMVDDWNRGNHVGRAVKVKRDSGEFLETTTRSHAELIQSGVPVIWLNGITGCYALERVFPIHYIDNDLSETDYTAAAGDVICDTCGLPYRKHPDDLINLGQHDIPFLVKLCDGRLVKL